MEWRAGCTQSEQRVLVSMAWLNQSEQYIQAGFLDQAEQILTEAWKLTAEHDSVVRSRTAWQIVWIKLMTKDYRSAAAWLEQVEQLPQIPPLTWLAERKVFVELCALLDQLQAPPALPVAAVPQPAPNGLQPLTIQSLGGFAITRGNDLLKPCRARKAVMMLRYLLTRPKYAATREELMELLWPETSPERASHSLHVTVSALRNYLDGQVESYLSFASGTYAINQAAPLVHDCAVFLNASDEADRRRNSGDLLGAQQAYTTAIAHYQGDYMLDSYDLAWSTAERERLLTRYLINLDHLGTLWMQADNPAAAVECFLRILQRDEYREDIHYKAIRCYMQLGRRGDAVRQYRRCEQILASELGVEPMPETRMLYHEILSS
ncbi:MAG: hypothetical protein OHK0022_31700 [Roseiflexaceae bacterium]